MNRAALLIPLVLIAACEAQPAAPPPQQSGTVQTPVGTAVDTPAATR